MARHIIFDFTNDFAGIFNSLRFNLFAIFLAVLILFYLKRTHFWLVKFFLFFILFNVKSGDATKFFVHWCIKFKVIEFIPLALICLFLPSLPYHCQVNKINSLRQFYTLNFLKFDFNIINMFCLDQRPGNSLFEFIFHFFIFDNKN